MKNRSKFPVIIAVLAFIIACWEGHFYYEAYPLWEQIGLIFHNALRIFILDPTITPQDLTESLSSDCGLRLVIGCLYTFVSTIIAPVCTTTAVFFTAESFLRRRFWDTRGLFGSSVFIFGYNEKAGILLDNFEGQKKRGRRLYLISGSELEPSEEKSCFRRGVSVISQDYPSMSPEAQEKLIKSYRILKAADIYLFYDEPMDNISTCLSLLRSGRSFSPGQRIFCRCESRNFRELLISSYDQQRREGRVLPELVPVDPSELAADEMFRLCPIYTENLKRICSAGELNRRDFDVHMLIAGFGSLGSSILRRAMSTAMLSSDSRIVFDIFDIAVRDNMAHFLRDISPECCSISPDGSEIVLTEPVCDGVLKLRLHSTDALSRDFETELREVLTQKPPVSYAAVCLGSVSDSLAACRTLLLCAERLGAGDFPLALRTGSRSDFTGFINENKGEYKNVFSIPGSGDLLSPELILQKNVYCKAREFNSIYSKIQLLSSSCASGFRAFSEDWDKMLYFRRASNIAAYLHEETKAAAFGLSPDSPPCLRKRGESLRRELEQLFTIGRDGLVTYSCTEEELTVGINSSEILREAAALEHRRWCIFMALNGWRKAAEPRSAANRQHQELCRENYCMCGWEQLHMESSGAEKYDLMPYLQFFIGEKSKGRA